MKLQDKFYKVVNAVLSDGNVHEVSEIHDVVNIELGLSRSQSTGRLYRLVNTGVIVCVDRGMYRLSSKSLAERHVNMSDSLWSALRRIDSMTKGIHMSTHELFNLTETDWEVVRLLKEINNMVQPVIAAHEVKEESADEQKDSTSN